MSNKIELRGRPISSPIRENIIELIYVMKEGYGYDLYKKYIQIFEQKINIRSIYYHLNKGVELGEFKIQNIEAVKGDYSWGDQVKRVIFTLGPNAKPRAPKEILTKIKQFKMIK